MFTMSEAGPKVVFIADVEHLDWNRAFTNFGITLTGSFQYFIDTFPNYSSNNEGIETAARNSDVLIIQKSLLRNRAGAATTAFAASLQEPNIFRERRLFDDDYQDPGSYAGCFEADRLRQEIKE